MRTRTRLPIDERRRQLLEAGLRLFAARPYPDVSVGEVAREAGVSHGLVFHYFGDKRGLYLGVVRAVADRLVAATAPASDSSPHEQLLAGLAAHMDFALRYPEAYVAFLHGGAAGDEDVAQIIEDAHERSRRHILDALAIANPPPALEIALRGWQGFTEAAIVAWLGDRRLPRAELLDMLAEMLSDTLRRGGFAG